MHSYSSMAIKTSAATRHNGFTLLELIIAIAISAVLIAMAVPQFKDSELRARLRLLGNDMLASAVLARSEAIKRRTTVSLCASSNGVSCTGDDWSKGWIVLAGDVAIHKRGAAPDGYLINSAVTQIQFKATGLGATPTSLTICRSAPYNGNQERVISVSGTGRTSIEKTTTGSCS